MSFSTKTASKMIKQLAGNGAGQSLMDRVTQAKYGIAGSALGKTVAKATTVEHIAPKKKHLDSSNNCPINQPNFNDKTTARSYEMSLYIRKYSAYLEEKTLSYRAMAFDFCKVKRSREDGVLRLMPTEKLLKALPVLEKQILILLEFDATEKDLDNPIINAAFVLLYKDLIRLFASYNEGMINLIEKYFTLKRKNCKVALDLYVRFTDLMNKVTQFLTIAEKLGIGDKDCLGLVPVPERVIKAMKQHLKLLNKKDGNLNDDEEEGEEEAKEVQKAQESSKVKKATPVKEEKSKKKTAKKVESSSESSGEEQEDSGLPSDIQKEIIATTLENLNKPKVNVIQPSPYMKKKKNIKEESPSSDSNDSTKETSSKLFGDSFVKEKEVSDEETKSKAKKKKSKKDDDGDQPVEDDVDEKPKRGHKKVDEDKEEREEEDEETHRHHHKKHKKEKKSKTEDGGGSGEKKAKKKHKKQKKLDDDDEESGEEEQQHEKKSKKVKKTDDETGGGEEEEKKKKKPSASSSKTKSAFDDLIDLDFLTGGNPGEDVVASCSVAIDPVPTITANDNTDKVDDVDKDSTITSTDLTNGKTTEQPQTVPETPTDESISNAAPGNDGEECYFKG